MKLSLIIFSVSMAYASTAVSEMLSLEESETILSKGNILSMTTASKPFSEKPSSMFSTYNVIYKNKFYICYSGIMPRGDNLTEMIGGVVMRCARSSH